MGRPDKPIVFKSYETMDIADVKIDASPIDDEWYFGLVFERIGQDRGNIDNWIVHMTLGNNTTHMPMKVFIKLKALLGDVKTP